MAPAFLPTMLGRFRLDALAPLAQGTTTGPPDFVGVGTGKAGTSWWFTLLLQHPQICQNRLGVKELHFFEHLRSEPLTDADIAHYHAAFACAAHTRCGEWSPNYMHYPLALENLAKAAPSAKLVAMLRNPVDRTLSAINQQHSTVLGGFSATPESRYIYETYSIFPKTVSNSLYADALRRMHRLVDSSQLLVLQYERCKRDPSAELARTYQFLEVDPSFEPQGLTRAVNQRDYVIPAFRGEQRRLLTDYFRDDVRATVELAPDLDLTLWPDFSLPAADA